MKNALGEALTLSNAGNWRETYRNAVGMYQQMNVGRKKEKKHPGACLITYCIFVVGTKKDAVQTENRPHNPPTHKCFGIGKGASCLQLTSVLSIYQVR